MHLTNHFQANNAWYPSKILTSLDLDSIATCDTHIQVLTNRAKPSSNTSCIPQRSAQGLSSFFCVFWRLDIWRCGNFNQRNAKTVEIVDDLFSMICGKTVQFASTVFFQTEYIDTNISCLGIENTIRRNECCSLKPACIRAINDRLSHRL